MTTAAWLASLMCGFTVVHGSEDAIRWPGSVTMTYDDEGLDAITDGSDIAAVKSAFAEWSSADCSTFRFIDGGPAQSGDVDSIHFVHDSTDWSVDGAAAFTTRTRNGDAWTTSSIYVDDFDLPWSTDGALRGYDFQSIITHELGHVLGLDHSGDPHATMYFSVRHGITFGRTIAADDRAGVCYLYPVSAEACATNADCPILDDTQGGSLVVTVCSGGWCSAGLRAYGEDCQGSTCAAGLTCVRFDDAPAGNPGVCTHACPCPGSDVCSNGNCAPNQTACIDDCGLNHTCVQDVDGDFVCAPECVTDDNCTAPAICYQPVSGSDAGLCRTPGPKATGLSCTKPSDCASLLCAVDTQGTATCEGPELATPTVTEDPPPSADSGSMDDGGVRDDDGSSGGDSFVDEENASLDPGSGGVVSSGGCAETAPSFMVMALAMLMALLVRRR